VDGFKSFTHRVVICFTIFWFINGGSVDLKNLTTSLGNSFNIDLGNYYRVFQEIRIRKQSQTTFLDQQEDQLLKRMDDSDENPKRFQRDIKNSRYRNRKL
jgi:hypothetical protein